MNIVILASEKKISGKEQSKEITECGRNSSRETSIVLIYGNRTNSDIYGRLMITNGAVYCNRVVQIDWSAKATECQGSCFPERTSKTISLHTFENKNWIVYKCIFQLIISPFL